MVDNEVINDGFFLLKQLNGESWLSMKAKDGQWYGWKGDW